MNARKVNILCILSALYVSEAIAAKKYITIKQKCKRVSLPSLVLLFIGSMSNRRVDPVINQVKNKITETCYTKNRL